MPLLQRNFPWLSRPPLLAAPMRTVTGAALTAAVSNAGGLGFFPAGYSADDPVIQAELAAVPPLLSSALPVADSTTRPFGIGFILFRSDLNSALQLTTMYRPAAVWFFAWKDLQQLEGWMGVFKEQAPWARVLVQVSSVADAEVALEVGGISVLVAQGVADAGGHGKATGGGSVVALVPELAELLERRGLRDSVALVAAGGIVDGRGVAAALALGAEGAVLGTRLVASAESVVPAEFKELLVRTTDGGANTVRTRLYDDLRGTGFWPPEFGGRAVVNESWHDHVKGVSMDENRRLYATAEKEGDFRRLTAYAGSGVGLIREVLPAREIVETARKETVEILRRKAAEYLQD